MIEAISDGSIDLAHDLKYRFDTSNDHIQNMTLELDKEVTLELLRQYEIKVDLDLDTEIARF